MKLFSMLIFGILASTQVNAAEKLLCSEYVKSENVKSICMETRGDDSNVMNYKIITEDKSSNVIEWEVIAVENQPGPGQYLIQELTIILRSENGQAIRIRREEKITRTYDNQFKDLKALTGKLGSEDIVALQFKTRYVK